MAGSTVPIKAGVLEDLATRFLINLPDEEKNDMLKLCSHMELAHWFYLDHLQPNDPSLPKCNIKEFIATIFRRYPFLAKGSSNDLDNIISKWRAHRHKQPLRGGIILNEPLTKCLLVQGYPFTCVSWGLPKGKIEQNEKDVDCAVREIYEETGLDARELINKDEYLEARLNGRKAKMFLVWGISEESLLAPRSLKEIKAIQWFPVEALPSSFKDVASKQETFNGVIPFVKPLRDWISRHQGIATVATNNTRNNATESFKPERSTTAPALSLQQLPSRSFSSPPGGNAYSATGLAASPQTVQSNGDIHASEMIKQLLHTPRNGLRRNSQLSVPAPSPQRTSSSQLHSGHQATSSSPVHLKKIHTPILSTTPVPSPITISTPLLKNTSVNRTAVPSALGTDMSHVGHTPLLKSTSLDRRAVPSALGTDSIPVSAVQGPVGLFPIPFNQALLGSSSRPEPNLAPIPLEPSKRLIYFRFDTSRILTGNV
eukprot:Em0009g1154a